MFQDNPTMYNTDRMKLLITGGHHSSAIPVINELQQRYPEIQIKWVGHRHSLQFDKNDTLEYIEITRLGIPFYELSAGKVYKTYNLRNILRIPLGFFQSFVYLLKNRPDMILSFGGYIAAPIVFTGWLLGIPSVTHEQTVVVGYANRFISLFVKKIFVSWKESLKYFPESKVIYTGMPIRKSILKISSNEFDANNELPYVFVFAGKSGSHLINSHVLASFETLMKKINLIVQTGDYSELNDFETLNTAYEKVKDTLPGKMFIKKFIFENEIGEAYGKADLVVARSGAHTVKELEVLHKRAVLIPISWVSHNEQFENAKILENKNLAVILDENNLTSEVFTDTILQNIGKTLECATYNEDISNSEKVIVDEIIKTFSKKIKKTTS